MNKTLHVGCLNKIYLPKYFFPKIYAIDISIVIFNSRSGISLGARRYEEFNRKVEKISTLKLTLPMPKAFLIPLLTCV